MLNFLEKLAVIYSIITLFVIELLYQTILAIIKGTQFSFSTLKNTVINTLLEILSDIIILLIDFLQSLIEGFATGWHKAMNTTTEFRRDVHH
jgi:hypothetical protein